MAFDLEVRGFSSGKAGERAREKLQKLVDRHAGEVWGQQTDVVGVGIGRLTDEKAARFYAALVDLAKKEGLAVRDPQADREILLAAAGTLPPGWSPPEPMDGAHFGATVERFGRGCLGPRGFLAYDWGAQRHVDGGRLLQRIAFRPQQDLFTIAIDWRFIFGGEDDPSWPVPVDLGDFIAGTPLEAEWPVALKKPRWGQLSAARADLDRSFDRTRRALDELILPLLDSIDSIESLVRAFEARRLGTVARQMKEPDRPFRDAFSMAFGAHWIGNVRNMALSYAHLGRLHEGKLRYHEWLAELGDPASLMDETDQKKLAAAQALFG